MNYKPFSNNQAFETPQWTETLNAWKKAQADKETAYRAFIKNLTEAHYFGYMNLPQEGDSEYDHAFLTISPQDQSANYIAVYTTIKELKGGIPKPEETEPGRKIEIVEVNYAFLVRELTLADENSVDGIVINPFTDDFIITLEEMENIAKRLCTGLNHTKELGNYTPANIFIKQAWKNIEGLDKEEQAQKFSIVLEHATEGALFALPIIVKKEDLVTEGDETFIDNPETDLAIRMLTSENSGHQANIIPLFTSQEDIEELDGWNAEDEERTPLLMTSDIHTHISGLNDGEGFDALVINPFTDNIVLTKDFLVQLGLLEGEEKK